MADQALVDLLNSGVDEWNNWRGNTDQIVFDLSDADLSYAFLNGAT